MIDEGEADDKIVAVLDGDNIWGDVHDIADLPDIKTERLQHYFTTYKMIPGKKVNIKVDREERPDLDDLYLDSPESFLRHQA